ncbi:MAG: 4Fe-4S binding protein [Kiritimatiellae bacterium]|nr:4Fe-4S binding protein [Kiritimatiellia bacterium]
MKVERRDPVAHLLRIAACLLVLAAGAVARSGRVLGAGLAPAAGAAPESRLRILPQSFEIRGSALLPNLAILAVLLLAAVVPLFAKSRRWRTVQLWLDVAVLGFWTGSFLSTARLLGWAGSGLPGGVFEWTVALLLLSTALLYPVFGRASHYCLWVCPFGAAQELASRIPARKWRLSPALVRRLTAFRRGLWAALALALLCGAWSRWTEWELFGAFAFLAVPPLVVAFALAFVALSVFVPRAYCRFVCPTGTLFKLAESNRPEPPNHPTTEPPNHRTTQP